MNQRNTHPDLGRLAADVAMKAARLERELVGAIISVRPPRKYSTAIEEAEAAGVTHGTFEQEDLRLIYLAASVSRERNDFPLLLRLAVRALKHYHYWDDSARWHTEGSTWGFENLAWLAVPEGTAQARPVPTIAAELVALCRIQRDASEHYEYAKRLLAAEVA